MSRYDGEIKACPFCGHAPYRSNLIDSLHPTTLSWIKSPFLDIKNFGEDQNYTYSIISPLQFLTEEQITEQGKYWEFSCLESEGGCGVVMCGLSELDVMNKWNNRVDN
ncbi:hypothetical protein [Yersinia phage fHe-Yen9-04]|uniref:Uncharacterized protein n=1 Tax=Yersinia phage fHe-Yen9-04 TaxID=2052742 RepID=A0A2C9CX24_9CAUD|nr:hypothetical protein FDJ41_gp172 [Yersinia phage fHe-Yen9-04]SOK58449.1 hypothetical protein [Yersinia phage fHe-Yen9-04]VUE36218.1 hypothetical protein [Yersinia phage fHe-Yen9-04]